MNVWTPAAVTKMVLRLAAFATVVYLVAFGSFSTSDAIAIGGLLAGFSAGLVPEDLGQPTTK